MADVTRRRFIKLSAFAAGAVAALPLIGRATEEKFGRVSVRDNWQLASRCGASVDGVEITNDCYEANDVEGYALCYVKGDNGIATFTDESRSELATKRLTGDVRIWIRNA